jgi:spore coat protein U-like protein
VACRCLWLAIIGAILAILLVPQEAKANAFCQADQPTLDFGSALTARGTINWTCTNFDPTPVAFTLCAAIGTPSYPGTPQQPKMIGSSPIFLDFNVYVDSAGNELWDSSTLLTANVAIAANGRTSGTFTYYGRIPPGQAAPPGSYSAFFYNTLIGILTTGTSICQRNAPDFSGIDVTLSVRATLIEACTLGTIGDIDFGELAGFRDQIDAAGSVQLVCPPNRGWTLSFDGGRHAAGTERRMQDADGNLVPYRLYRDAARTDTIAIDGSVTGAGTGAAQTVPVYGPVEIGALPPVGQYSDFVVVTLGF